jgi:hypothetical protein
MRMLKSYLQSLKGQLGRLLLFSALVGCLSPINVDIENVPGTVVIGGHVSNLPDHNVVQLGLTADTERLPFPVSGAGVWIVDETTGESIRLFESGTPGEYRPENYAGVPGHAYHVQVQFPNRGTFTSETDIMPPLVGTMKTHYEFENQQYTDLEGVVSEQQFLLNYVDGQMPETSEDLYLRWSVEEVFLLSPTDFPDPFGSVPPPCFVAQNADPQRIVLLDGSRIHTTQFKNLLVASRIVDWTFLEKHAFTTYQSSISAAAYAYWAKVDILSNQTGSIFDTPPAALTGNLHGENSDDRVFGYFHAAAETFDRYFIYRSDLPFPLTAVTDCQYYGYRTEYPSRCLDCTSARNSSYNRPDWF